MTLRIAERCRVVVDNDWAGDPDGLVALAHHLLSRANRVVAVTGSANSPVFGPPAGTAAAGARLAQELALIAVKADVTEELDRLEAHVAAARALVAQGGAVGRRLDFLMQEFNREANTLCSKSGSSELTAIGLELKASIDQMREQVQNVE